MTRLISVFALALLAASPAMAHETATAHDMHDMAGMSSANHMHAMPATVTKADIKTGLLDVISEGMALKLHFPPSSLSGIKPGDKITLHLGFSKP